MADKLRMSTNELVDMVTTLLDFAIANNGSELKSIECYIGARLSTSATGL